MLISANIPLNKVSNKQFISFMEKYTNRSVSTESTLRKNYLSSCYEDAVRRVRNIIGDNKIWISINELTNVDSRCVASVIVGTLFADRPGNIFVLHSEVLDKVSHTTIAILFDSAMKMLWKDEVKRDRILLFVTDAAPYMLKAAKGLKMLYPRMVHLTCLVHGLHRVAEEIRGNYPDVDSLISSVKKIFLKASLRVEKFKQEAPSLSGTPNPVLTRWETWLDAAMYYCENYSTIGKIVSELESNEASSVKFVKELFSSDLSGKLAYMKSKFLVVSKTIACLEAVGVEMNDALDIVKSTERAVEQARGSVAENLKKKQIQESAGAKLWVFNNM
jgi:hypothetical protein